MITSITPKQIKKTNRQMIYDYIYREKNVSQQDISYALRLSRPTVASNLAELEADGLIYKSGQQNTELIGRKAVNYSVVEDYRVAIGVEVLLKQVKIIAVDLYGKKIDRVVYDLEYKNEEQYFITVCDSVKEYIGKHSLKQEQILGIGFSIQGLISSDGTTVVYGAILRNSGLTIDSFSRHLPYPCRFIHDPKSAALSELWVSPEIKNAIYISLSKHLGGAMITNGQVHPGLHGHNATFEHIRMQPGGKRCYCGRYGCAETICSMNALLGEEDPDLFFSAVRSGKPEETARWKEYLGHLADMIDALHLVRDVNIILGGYLAQYLTAEDINYLYKAIKESSMPFDEEDDFLLLSKMPSHSITIGAALMFIREFLEDIDSGRGISV